MAADYTVKAGSVPGPLVFSLAYSDGTEPDLSTPGTTATFRMRPYGVDPAVIVGACAILDATRAAYQFGADELADLAGAYQCEIHVEWTSGRDETFPADPERPYFVILVEPAIAEGGP